MENICYNCFSDSLNDAGICEKCGFDGAKNREKYPLALPLGSILYGRYIVGRVLGQGGFGITYLAQDYQTKGLVAIKEFFPDSMATRTEKITVCPLSGERGENFAYGLNSFLEEAKTMAEFIGNPNITRVDSYFEENGTGYFVMEYLDGDSFLDYIKSHGGRLGWEDTMRVALPIMDALAAMHEKGIIHRDVTPDNIYITKDGTVKLLDFGAARYSLGNVSRSLDVILKHGFAPKEQYSRHGRQGPYTDVYSLGATIYYAITGVKPDDAIERSDEDNLPLPTTLGAKISIAQEEALLKALAVAPADRYQSMTEFRAAITAPKPKADPKSETKPKPAPAKKLPKWLIPAAAVLAVVVIGASILGGRDSGKKTLEASASEPAETAAVISTEWKAEDIVIMETTAPAAPTETFEYLGGTYEGAADNGVPSGFGTLTWKGYSYSGNFADGYPYGTGVFTVSVGGSTQTYQKDSWDITSMDCTLAVQCDWMNQTVRETVGQYQGMTYTDSAGNAVPCGFGMMDFHCGGSYIGAFAGGVPSGYGEYTTSSGTSMTNDWTWVTQERAVFDTDYPQSVQYYTGMVSGNGYWGFGAMSFEHCGVYFGEFLDGDVGGSGKYIYRMYNHASEVEGTNWGVVRGKNLGSGLTGSGLTLNGSLQGYGMSKSNQYKTYYIGEVENGLRSGYGRYFNASGEERMDRRGLYVKGMFSKSA